MESVREELEIVQKALKLQTKRCRQLVAEYTRKLQEKEQQYYNEKMLRDDQLAKVLRTLLIFEARLKQEQKYISHQLNEKDYIIKKQKNDIKKLLSNQYCKNCNQYYTSSPLQESLDSSSEYVGTDYQDYQSSNFESLDSSSETYATLSEKGYNLDKSESPYLMEDGKIESDSMKSLYKKNRMNSYGRRSKKVQHRKSIGTYFEVLKLRNETESPGSNEDNTSNDYDNLESLPPESVTDKISLISENIENIFNKKQNSIEGTESSPNVSLSECNNTVIDRTVVTANELDKNDNQTPDLEENLSEMSERKYNNISESIPVFETEGEANDNWYASASDQEDEEHRDLYRNNPVLECMNQILLQNINDNLSSPPKSPNMERKSVKTKKVKFSDEDKFPNQDVQLTEQNLKEKQETNGSQGYYETPVQKPPNFYETPQSIYSNDYEQILSKCSESFNSDKNDGGSKKPEHHFYIDMDKPEKDVMETKLIRKSKILRTPPALPPKPANLVSKYKLQKPKKDETKDKLTDTSSEPDYCSISELNLPVNQSFKKINVVAEINSPSSNDVRNKLEKIEQSPTIKSPTTSETGDYDPVMVNDNIPNLVIKKCVEKFNIQMAKQTPIKSEVSTATINLRSAKKNEPEIPKLPQVSEIIIPDENEEVDEKEERISHDNYVKNNSQIFKLKSTNNDLRRSIVIGSSVSSIITGFNNQQVLSEIKKKPERNKLDKKLFSSFENLQNLDKHLSPSNKTEPETPNFENYDLSQNFEEFKLDDCEIEEYNVDDVDIKDEPTPLQNSIVENAESPPPKIQNATRVELIRARDDILIPPLNRNSIELLKKQLSLQKHQATKPSLEDNGKHINEPTYEHFLECTGLSSKSILNSSRLMGNHRKMLKPKDVKLKSKIRSNNALERNSTSTIKYWSEPFI